MSKRVSLENQIFSWKTWDDVNTMCILFYNVELMIPVGEFPKGHKFDTACLDQEKSVVSFVDVNGEYIFQLNLSVGEKISKEELYPLPTRTYGALPPPEMEYMMDKTAEEIEKINSSHFCDDDCVVPHG